MKTLNADVNLDPILEPNRSASINVPFVPYSLNKSREIMIPKSEYENARKRQQDYLMMLEVQEAENEISEFEKKHFGEFVPAPYIKKEPLNQRQEQILKQFSTTDEQYMYDAPIFRPSSRSSTSSEYVSRPSYWNLVDEPLLLSKNPKYNEAPSIVHTKPFILAKSHMNTHGIPLLAKDLLSSHKKNMKKLNERVLLHQTFDNQRQEEQLRKSYEISKAKTMDLTNKRIVECARLGQKWAIKKLSKSELGGSRLPKLIKKEEKPLSPFDIEAINAVNRKVQSEIDEEKEKLYLSSKHLEIEQF